MARDGWLRRHRVGVASGTVLAVAAATVVAYAVVADGYKAHETELNDGGVWVVNGAKGIHGRINKPINQLDGVVQDERDKLRLDVVQDGAAVVGINVGAGQGRAVDPRRLAFADGGSAALPEGGDVQLRGGTLASIDRGSGGVWVARADPQTGALLTSSVDRQSEPVESVGEGASLAVTEEGTVVAVSSDESTVTRIEPTDEGFADSETAPLPDAAGAPDAVTAVGQEVVVLDSTTGQLTVLGAGSATVPEGSVLQQPGPAADAVLVATPDGLLSVGLGGGTPSVVAEAASGRPVAPVRLGSCIYAAWSGGLGALAVGCGDDPATVKPLGGDATNLAFRVNRGEIVLNDARSGAVWDLDRDAPIRIDNWNAFTAKKQDTDEEENEEQNPRADRRPPLARPDSFGARPGRVSVLHPLDNDSAPEGRLLSIVDVSEPTGGARVQISPDGQTLVLEMPERARPTTFDYFIDDGRRMRANARVSVAVRDQGQNARPALRKGFEPRSFKVPSGGSLSVPVLADWRDNSDGDTLLLDSVRALGRAEDDTQARPTSDGRIRFTAPSRRQQGAETVTVEYAVTDGRSAPVAQRVDFDVQAARDQRSFAPTAEPDVVRGEVGKPIRIRPLLNDLPGSDPADPQAELTIGGRIPDQAGLDLVTDADAGVIAATASKAGTYFLDYDAAFGNAPMDQATIRVDVKPRPGRAQDPVAMPDAMTIFGQTPGLVDVLANDLDPAGGLLVVQRATPTSTGQLDVAIVDGRWLRVSARRPDLVPATQTIEYVISNGANTGVRGEVVVTQRAAPEDNTPVTVTDRVVVRAGSSVAVPVLDNDTSPSGDRLTLVGDDADGVVGELRVMPPLDVTGEVGTAFVSGRLVRYVAPRGIKERDTYEVPYIAGNAAGQTAPGLLKVTIAPVAEENTPPEPPTLEGRVVSGDVVKVRVPGTGVDAQGDPVTVTGILDAPALGRIVGFGGNFIEFQAYPRTVGTDTFTYAVVDAQGAVGVGTARVVVVEPGTPQPPLAVADRLSVEPGRTATFDPLANDFIAPGDEVVVELLDPPDGVRLDPETDLVTMAAPKALDATAIQVVYRLTNGLAESRSTLTLQTAGDYDNPPVVYDAFGRADDSGSVLVDVLEGAYDPDGPTDKLRVTRVYGEPEATVEGGSVRVPRGPEPKVVPFRVEDAAGSAATASLYVPATGNPLPYVDPDALIEMDPGSTFTGSLDDFVVTPPGSELRVTGRAAWSATPAQALSAAPDGGGRFRLTAGAGFRGPGAVLVQVTTATDPSGNEDVADADDGFTLTLSIPVRVGDDNPVLECPSTVIPISAGAVRDVDVATLCKVWTLDPRDADGLAYEATWAQGLDDLSLSPLGGALFRVQASPDASTGGDAVLRLRAGASNTQDITFRLAGAPPPSMLPIPVEDLRAGESRTIDLAPYLEAGVADPDPTVISVTAAGQTSVRATSSGSRVTLSAPDDAGGGAAAFRIVMSDVSSSDPGPRRRAEGRISFQVRGVPGAPTRPFVTPNNETGAMRVQWGAPRDDGGSPISHYVVETRGRGKTQACRTTVCDIRGLEAGKRYTFRVAAVNKVGRGPWSDLSKQAFASTNPGRVDNIRMTSRGDGTITIAWDKPRGLGSRILEYYVAWAGGSTIVSGDTLNAVATGLDNNTQYTFSIKALNDVGFSPARVSAPMQPLGTPAAPAAPTVTDLESGPSRTTVRVTWPGTPPQGPGPTLYTVQARRGAGPLSAVPGCQRIAATVCNHSGVNYDGATWTYTVRAQNQPRPEPPNVSTPSAAASFAAIGRPAGWGDWSIAPTGGNQEARVGYTVPASRGAQSTVRVLVGGREVASYANATGTRSDLISVPSNEGAYAVTLRLCNENSCTDSAPRTVQTYGPLTGEHLGDPVVTSNPGSAINFNVSGTGNGRAARLIVTVRNGQGTYLQQERAVGPGAFTQAFTADVQRYLSDATIEARLVDTAAGRGPVDRAITARSGPPPPPAISLSKGPACSDNEDDAAPGCRRGPADPPCDGPTCARLNINVSGWQPGIGFACRIDGSTNGWFRGEVKQFSWEDGTKPTDWYFGSGFVTVVCQSSLQGPVSATMSY